MTIEGDGFGFDDEFPEFPAFPDFGLGADLAALAEDERVDREAATQLTTLTAEVLARLVAEGAPLPNLPFTELSPDDLMDLIRNPEGMGPDENGARLRGLCNAALMIGSTRQYALTPDTSPDDWTFVEFKVADQAHILSDSALTEPDRDALLRIYDELLPVPGIDFRDPAAVAEALLRIENEATRRVAQFEATRYEAAIAASLQEHLAQTMPAHDDLPGVLRAIVSYAALKYHIQIGEAEDDVRAQWQEHRMDVEVWKKLDGMGLTREWAENMIEAISQSWPTFFDS